MYPKNVNWLKTIGALALAAIWPLVTSHCDIETVSGFAFLDCGVQEEQNAPHHENDCDTDGCAVIEAGIYKTEDGQVDLPARSFLAAAWLPTLTREISSNTATRISVDSSPPELPNLWQFSQRAAAPPRAPSFVS